MTVVVVCGGRDFKAWSKARWALDYWHQRLGFSLLVQGGQVSMDPAERSLPWDKRTRWGADYIAKRWAMAKGIPNAEEAVSDADWKKFDLAAGPMRNTRMLMKYKPQRVIAFAGGKGTADMLDQARRAGVKCIEVA